MFLYSYVLMLLYYYVYVIVLSCNIDDHVVDAFVGDVVPLHPTTAVTEQEFVQFDWTTCLLPVLACLCS